MSEKSDVTKNQGFLSDATSHLSDSRLLAVVLVLFLILILILILDYLTEVHALLGYLKITIKTI